MVITLFFNVFTVFYSFVIFTKIFYECNFVIYICLYHWFSIYYTIYLSFVNFYDNFKNHRFTFLNFTYKTLFYAISKIPRLKIRCS